MATDAIVPQLSPLGQAALDYAARGIPVFPLVPRTKRPITEKGFYDATTDEDQIRRWWRKTPAANIGIPTGVASGWLVLDMDVRYDATLADLEARFGAVPDTLIARTGSDGWHIVFAHPGGIVGGKKLDGNRYEIKADGGYIVAAPSIHPDTGRAYAWENRLDPAPMPGWLSRALVAEEAAPRPKYDGAVIAPTDAAQHWLDWAMRKTGAGIGDHMGFLLAQQLMVNGVAEVEQTLAQYALQATLNPKDPFTLKDVQRWMRQAAKSRLVQSGERARAQSAPLSLPKRAEKKPDLRLVEKPGHYATEDAEPPNANTERKRYERTEFGNMERLLDAHGQNVRYCKAFGFCVWDGTRWKSDSELRVRALAEETIRRILQEASDLARDAAQTSNDGERDLAATESSDLLKWAKASQKDKMVTAMVNLLKHHCEVDPDTFDREPMLFNCLNGTVDLRTGALRAHRREDYLMQRSPIAYRPDAQATRFEQFVSEIMLGREDLIHYMHRVLGYCLSGDVSEQVWHVLHGEGENGKSTLMEAIADVLGEYATDLEPESVMATSLVHDAAAPSPDIAKLKGKRLVKITETEEGQRINAAKVKRLSGQDTLTGRHLRKDIFSFKPNLKLFIYTNHRPQTREMTHAFWRRVRLVPFDFSLKDNPHVRKDEHLPQKLAAESEGILAWLVRGCLAWQGEGMRPPKEVLDATAAYQSDMDVFTRMVSECFEQRFGAETPARRAYNVYKAWCKDNGEREMSETKFAPMMMQRFKWERRDDRQGRFWSNQEVREEWRNI